jgi:aminoglycoside 6'-N-acetyltransferase I
VQIETCNYGHADNWADLRAKLWPRYSLEYHRTEISDLLSKSANNRVAFIAIAGTGQAIGFAEAALRHDFVNGCESSPVIFLEGIYVIPSARRGGVAMSLYKMVEAWGIQSGCHEIASDTPTANTDSQIFHKVLGFEERERVVFFRKVVRESGRDTQRIFRK